MNANVSESNPSVADRTGSRTLPLPPRRGVRHTPGPDHAAALRELTIAARRDVRESTAPSAPRRRGLLLAALLGTGIALVVVWSIPPRFRCAATLEARYARTETDRHLLETEWLEHWWHMFQERTADLSHVAPARFIWTGDESLTFNVTTDAPERTTARLRDTAEALSASLDRRAAESRETPTNAEQVLAEYADVLRRDLADADARVQAAMTALPDSNPKSEQGALLGQWEQVRATFDATRGELVGASASLTRLRAEPDASHGIVSAAERRDAFHADEALQNDLDELTVNLTELKLHLLNVGVQTAPLLDALASAADAMRSAAAGATRSADPADAARALARIETASARYRKSFDGFSQTWRQTFDRIRTQEVDPMTASILDANQELTERLNGFLFASAGPLTTMRGSVNAIGQLKNDNARYHVLQSNLARVFQTLQTAHHRFEFTAGGIDGTDRFRLDAARRSAYGLHRRTQARIRRIDAALQRTAAERARRNHQQALVSAVALVRRIRGATTQTVDQLVQLQERLNAATKDSEAFQEATHLLDVAVARLELTRAHVDETQTRLARLQAKRLARDTHLGATLVSCGVVGDSINRTERGRAAALAFSISFLAVVLGQWWVTRAR